MHNKVIGARCPKCRGINCVCEPFKIIEPVNYTPPVDRYDVVNNSLNSHRNSDDHDGRYALKSEAKSLEQRLDLIVKGSTNAEVVDARKDMSGTFRATIGERISVDIGRVSEQLADKATKQELANIGNASPKGTYTTVSALQTAFPNGTTGIYVVTADGNWYYWNGTAWTSGGQYQSTGVAGKSITPDKLTFSPAEIITGKNLFNKDTVTTGKYVVWDTGLLGVNDSYSVSDYIPVTQGETYMFSVKNQIAYYDESFNYVSGVNELGSNLTGVIPNGVSYLRITVSNANVSKLQIEKGSIATTYEPYNVSLKPNIVITNNNIKDVSISREKIIGGNTLVSVELGKNLFNKNTVTSGFYVNWESGVLISNATYSASDYIPIQPSTTYMLNKKDQISFYDVNKLYISGVNGVSDNTSVTTPTNAVYMRVSVKNVNLDILQVEKGVVATPYEAYGHFIPIENIPKSIGSYQTIQGVMKKVLLETDVQIKLIGDSITAGVGGTGYTMDGETIFGSYKVNTNGYCWANLLKNYLESKFDCTVKNWGTSGVNSSTIIANLPTLIEEDDDIIICMVGTNDRNTVANMTPRKLVDNIMTIGNYVKGQGKEIIFMSNIPTSVTNETDTSNSKLFHMEDVDMSIMSGSNNLNQEYISLYKQFLNYCDYKNVTIDSLLADGIHPNDNGYNVMFRLICDSLGIARKRPGSTW